MSKTARRSSAERIAAKEARAYVEQSRRRAQTVVQQAVVDRFNQAQAAALAEEARREARAARRDRHAGIAVVVAIALVCFVTPSVFAIAALIQLVVNLNP